MMKIAMYDTKPYDKEWFEKKKPQNYEMIYYETKLRPETASLADGCEVVCAFVNDIIDAGTIDKLYEHGVRLIALRCAGFNNVDRKAAEGKIQIVRVPAYSPYAVAEHAMGMLLCLNRKLHKAYNRTREGNFTLNGLTGFDLHEKTIGVVGTGKIGKTFIHICQGFDMNVLAYDPYPDASLPVTYVEKEELFRRSDIISLHCPLTSETHHLINEESIGMMKDGVMLINTSRGALVKKEALLSGLKEKKIGAAGLDVYEEEAEYFYEDYSNEIIEDEVLALLVSMPNVLVTSHQAFLTNEALQNIAETTLANIRAYEKGEELVNRV